MSAIGLPRLRSEVIKQRVAGAFQSRRLLRGRTDMTTIKELQAEGVEILRFVFADLNGVQRGKDVAIGRSAHAVSHGKAFVEAVMTIDLRHNIVSGDEGGFRDFVAIPDLSTARISSLEPDVAQIICSLSEVPSGLPSGLDSRGSVQRIVERYVALGYHPVIASELEFYLLERAADGVGGLRPAPMVDSCVYTAGPLADPTGIVRRMFDACEAFGLQPVSCAQEYGHSQYEINLVHGAALEATDRAFLFKSLIKQVAAAEGLVATFMGLPVDADECSGFHLHASLNDAAGHNAFDDPASADGLAPVAHQFAAGVIAHAPAIAGLLNPTVNAYKRIATGGLAPKFANWGHDNRLAMLRFCHERGPATRAEVRSGDGAANPYLATAAILAAGLDGIERKLELPPPVVSNFYEGAADFGQPLPTSLGDALDALEADQTLVDLVGPALVETFLRNKRYELDRWNAELLRLTAWEIDEYAERL